MLTDEIFSTLLIIGGFIAFLIIVYIFSKIPGSGIIFRFIRGLFLILWSIVVFCLTFFMFFMVGYLVIVFFTFNGSEEGILFQGEPINFLIGDNAKHAAFFVMLYAGFCLVSVYILSFLLRFGGKASRIVRRFYAEIILVITVLFVFTIFPTIVEMVLPDFEVGRYGKYTLTILPLTMYIQAQIKKAKERNHGRYPSRKERFYLNLDKKDSKKKRIYKS